MSKAPLALKAKGNVVTEAIEPNAANTQSQKRPETKRYWLQVDRQTKSSHETFEGAQSQGVSLKRRFPQLQVAIYDREASKNTLVETPAS